VRLACRLGDANVDVARAFAERSTRNVAPSFAVEVPARVTTGGRVEFIARWSPDSAEEFVVYDRVGQTLATQREAIVVSFFATAGVFDVDRVGRDAEDRWTTVTNGWTAPDRPNVVSLWFVARDSRGAATWSSAAIVVEERR
jgi:hypothetical protein